MYVGYANTTPFYMWDLSILGFWYSRRFWNQPSMDTEGLLYSLLKRFKLMGLMTSI